MENLFTYENIINGLKALGIFIIAGSIHEFAHAASAYHLGDPTAKDQGRMTLNPLAHIDPIGTILFPIIAQIGWMKPVPVYLGNLKHPLKDDAIISFAGPFSNFVQACLAILVLRLFDFPPFIYELIGFYATINILLMGFNLLPFPPLDGGAILRYFLPTALHEYFDQFSRYSFILLIILFYTGMLSYFLTPFFAIFNIIIRLDIFYLVILNLVNVGIILYFYRSKLKPMLNKSGSIKPLEKGKPSNISNENKSIINTANQVIPKLEKGLHLSESEKNELEKIEKSLNAKATMCSLEDYDINDLTCHSCEWFKDCLMRQVKKIAL